jgi:hypothetical protein
VDHPSHPREEKEQFFPSPGNKKKTRKESIKKKITKVKQHTDTSPLYN